MKPRWLPAVSSDALGDEDDRAGERTVRGRDGDRLEALVAAEAADEGRQLHDLRTRHRGELRSRDEAAEIVQLLERDVGGEAAVALGEAQPLGIAEALAGDGRCRSGRASARAGRLRCRPGGRPSRPGAR